MLSGFPVSVEHVQQQLHGPLSQGLQAHVHGGQRRACGQGHHLPVVVSGDGDVAGDAEAALAQPVRPAPGKLV